MDKRKLAKELGVTVRTITRYLNKGHEYPDWLKLVNNGKPFSYAPGEDLPEPVVSYLKDKKGAPAPPFEPEINFSTLSGGLSAVLPEHLEELTPKQNNEWNENFTEKLKDLQEDLDTKNTEKDSNVQEVDSVVQEKLQALDNLVDRVERIQALMDKFKEDLDSTEDQPVQSGQEEPTLADKILEGDIFSLVSLFILIAADSFSLAWISYDNFKNIFAASFFGLVGMAVAYSSIRNAIKVPTVADGYTSQNLAAEKGRKTANAWLFGFGAVQFLLHAAAFDMFSIDTYDNASMAIGAFVICLAIPFSTAGLAITHKKRVSNDHAKFNHS